MILFQSQPQISGIFVITLLTNWLQIYFIKLGLDRHLLVAGGAGEVVDAPGLVEGREHVALDHLVADVAKVSKQLMVVSLAIGQTLPLIMTIAQERFLTLGTDKVLHAPMFAQSCDNTVLNGPPAGSTNGDTHLVVATETVELVEFLGRVAWSSSHLPGRAGQLNATSSAVEVVWTIVLSSEPQGLPINGRVTLLTHVLPHTCRFYLCITFMTESSSLILDEAKICQFLVTHLTTETLRMPSGSHRLDDPSNDEFSALGAAGSIEDMEAMLAIFPVLELVEDSIRKLSEALGADEAPRAVQLTIAVHYLGFGFESIFTASTGHAVEVHNSWHDQRLAETRSRSVSRCVPRCSLD